MTLERDLLDVDALAAALAPAVAPLIMDDDQWCLERCVDFGYSKDNPRVEVTVWRA